MLIIKIEEALNEDGGYMIDIYDNEEAMANCEDSLDGGQCTSEDINDALGMAHAITENYIKHNLK